VVPVSRHFAQRKNNRVSDTSFEKLSLTRFLFEPSAQGDEYIAHRQDARVTVDQQHPSGPQQLCASVVTSYWAPLVCRGSRMELARQLNGFASSGAIGWIGSTK
jgi:hypothetical protein